MNLKSNQSNDLSSQERHDLYQENKHLKKQLRDLLDSVGSYRSTQHRFENYEVKLLECQTFKELINCLLLTISVDFNSVLYLVNITITFAESPLTEVYL